MTDSATTTDHEEIRHWVEQRSGRPACVQATENGSSAVLRIDFREPDEGLEEIPWEEFFRIFDENNLAFLHQDRSADGKVSRFHKFVHRP